ncbi:MAG: hypothetical protein IKJ89_06520, partial [Kiritimatiellae bacterium]|nr:hypothetical protein [Kiritimatiellia bacterium]
MKLLTFPSTTALQRKLTFGALDFSPLHHSTARAEREHYTKNRSWWSGKLLAKYSSRRICRVEDANSKRRQDGIST